mmetsp:Transcript_9980/g.12516  ORF Transcript_9980/g.12516 Transcript_9980/m.12516 type:complete len:86 (+) Transcript_9980:2316-2573(+)
MFLLVKFDQLSLQSLSYLHLREGLLVAPTVDLDALCMVRGLREGVGACGCAFGAARGREIVITVVEAVAAFTTLNIRRFLLLGRR